MLIFAHHMELQILSDYQFGYAFLAMEWRDDGQIEYPIN